MTRKTESATLRYTSPRIAIEDRCAPAIVDRLVEELEPFLLRAAAYIADELPSAVADMMQEARITLWELDLGRFAQRDAAYLQRILCNRMIDVYRKECRRGLTGQVARRVVSDA